MICRWSRLSNLIIECFSCYEIYNASSVAILIIYSGTSGTAVGRGSSGASPTIEDPYQIRLRVQVHIAAGVSDHVFAFVDSGRNRSTVSRDLAVKLGAVDLCRGRKSFRTLGGYLVVILGRVSFNVTYQWREGLVEHADDTMGGEHY